MSTKVSAKAPVTFKDVAIYFSETEWKLLEGWQMELYRNTMCEIHGTLISLGYTIINPDVVFRLKEVDLLFPDESVEGRLGFSKSSTGYLNLQPDILLRIKFEENHELYHHHDLVHRDSDTKDTGTGPDAKISISPPDKKEEDPESSGAYESKASRNYSNPSVGNNAEVLKIKEESEPRSILCPESDQGESTDSAMSEEVSMQAGCQAKFSTHTSLNVQDPENKTNDGLSYHEPKFKRSFLSNPSENSFLFDHGGVFQRVPFSGFNQDTRFDVPLLQPIGGGLCLSRENEEHFTQNGSRDDQQIHSSEEKQYKCDECDKWFSRNSHLTVHKRTHNGEMPYQCIDCEKTFSEYSHLTVHQRIHTGEKRYICMYCEKSFSENSNLIVHQRIHTGEKPYQCSICDNRFSQHSSLVRHKRMHTGYRPYKCTECVKTFNQKGHLSNHLRTHTGERPYKCLECDKTFSEYSHLTGHLKIHTGEKPYKCTECGKGFSKISNLKAHVKIHSGYRPYTCTECGKSFTQFSTLVRHQKIHRRKSEPVFRKLEAGVQDGKIKWTRFMQESIDKADTTGTEWPAIQIVEVEDP